MAGPAAFTESEGVIVYTNGSGVIARIELAFNDLNDLGGGACSKEDYTPAVKIANSEFTNVITYFYCYTSCVNYLLGVRYGCEAVRQGKY